MPQKLFTFDVLCPIMLFCAFLKDVAVLFRDRIPYLGLPFMDVVYSRQIEVFFVPTEKGLPGANIAVRFSNSLYFVRHRIFEKRIKRVHVPTSSCLIHQRTCEVRSINRRGICDSLPKLLYLFFTSFSFSSLDRPLTFSLYLSEYLR